MNNPVFGKTMENVDNWRAIKLVTHWENRKRTIGAGSLISRPNFKSCSIFKENCGSAYRKGESEIFQTNLCRILHFGFVKNCNVRLFMASSNKH